jgi:hypothetical protein
VKKATPFMVVAFACVVAFLGVWRRDFDAIDAVSCVACAVGLGAHLHAKARRKAKKAFAKPSDKNGATP